MPWLEKLGTTPEGGFKAGVSSGMAEGSIFEQQGVLTVFVKCSSTKLVDCFAFESFREGEEVLLGPYS